MKMNIAIGNDHAGYALKVKLMEMLKDKYDFTDYGRYFIQAGKEMEHGVIAVTEGWIRCPVCRRNKKLLQVLPDTSAKNLEVYCRICKRTMILNIEPGQHVILQDQWGPERSGSSWR